MVSAFASTVVVGWPLLAPATTGARRRTLLAVWLTLFVLGNAVSAATPAFAVIAAGLVVAALAHAGLMPLFFGLAADAVPARQRGPRWPASPRASAWP
ncbi:hypothetical protein ACIQU6_37440 [Streptomyces sp. NPDC090442]|uniref:hypothetical protein n=1 Tax=Streptomyces sp. NPDC090442 TaxID=3365962 RepID=UPI0037FD5ACF